MCVRAAGASRRARPVAAPAPGATGAFAKAAEGLAEAILLDLHHRPTGPQARAHTYIYIYIYT